MSSIEEQPLIYPYGKEELIEKIRAFAKAYTPEWRFNTAQPDIGSTIALLYADLLKQDIDVFNAALEKHHIGFLNCLETDLKPAIPAQSYVTFEMIPSVSSGTFIPKGSKLMAKGTKGENVPFITCHGVYASHCEPTEFMFFIPSKDRLLDGDPQKKPLQNIQLSLFDKEAINLQNHNLYLAHPYLLSHTREGRLRLELKKETCKFLAQLETQGELEWYLLGPQENIRVHSQLEGDHLYMVFKEIIPTPVKLYEVESYWLKASLKPNSQLPKLETDVMKLGIEKAHLVPDTIYAQGLEKQAEGFEPFGNPLEIYAETYIRCDEAFAKPGASITLDFELNYITKENKVEVGEPEVDFKLIMRQPRKKVPLDPIRIRVDEVLWEYWNGKGWVRLFKEQDFGSLFNGQREGKIQLSFICPEDMTPITVEAYEAKWIRVRMMRADHLYTYPSIECIPQIKDLSLSYSCEVVPKKIMLENHMEVQDITYPILQNQSVFLFETCPYKKPTFFLGFDELPSLSPMCLFFDIDHPNITIHPQFEFTYSTLQNNKKSFKSFKVSDGTYGLTRSGNMMIILPKDFKKISLFAKEKYWIKLENISGEYEKDLLNRPTIKGIYKNTARVINEVVEEEYHYIKQKTGSTPIRLNKKNIIDLEVYVDERPLLEERNKLLLNPCYEVEQKKDAKGELINFWVKWKKCESLLMLEPEKRNFYLDYSKNEIIFPDNIFTYIPVNDHYQAIKVKYWLCDGETALVEEKQINMMVQPLSYVKEVRNPVPAFGGKGFETLEQATKRSFEFLQNRDKAITLQDYEELVKAYSSTVKRVACKAHINDKGEEENRSITLVILEEDYNKGNHAFLTYKDQLEAYLLERSDISLLNRKLYIRQPDYIALNARVWIETQELEKAFEYQSTIKAIIEQFIHPIKGNFDGLGWGIGRLPKINELDAYLKAQKLNCMCKKMILTVNIPTEEGDMEKDINDLPPLPFVIPISGSHEVIIEYIQ